MYFCRVFLSAPSPLLRSSLLLVSCAVHMRHMRSHFPGSSLTHSSWIEINRRVRIALAEHPSFTQLYKDILRKGVNRSNEPVTKVVPTSGAILYSVQEVLVSCLIEYVAHLFTTQLTTDTVLCPSHFSLHSLHLSRHQILH